MFILRRITGQGFQINQIVGDDYGLISRGENYEEFKKCFLTYFDKPHLDDKNDDDTKNVYAFISFNCKLQPLYNRQRNYMMTSNGQTFANLNSK